MRSLVFDIEGNGLLEEVTKVHCAAVIDPDTREQWDFKFDKIGDALELLSKADRNIAHFGLGYDFPVLEKLHGYKPKKAVDSYIVSKLIKSGVKDGDSDLVRKGTLPAKMHGKHSIEAWGYRLGRPKLHTDIEDWSEWTPEIHERCIGDTWTNVVLWDYLKADEYSQDAIEREHRVAALVRRMEWAGCPFDEKGAQELHVKLVHRQDQLSTELINEFGYWFEPLKKKLEKLPGLARIKHPDHKSVYVANYWKPKRANPNQGYWGPATDEWTIEQPGERPVKVVGYPVTKVEKTTFNPSSRRHIVKQLQKLGWEPQTFTPSGEPELSDDVLEGLSDTMPQAGALVEFLLLDKRLGQLSEGDNAWLKKVGKDGRMHGSIDTMGTLHGRASHFSPNMSQVPASKSPYGAECRGLFGPNGLVIKGAKWVQVGADMSGLQLRGLAHELFPLDGGAYCKIVTEGDVHWAHCQAMGLVGADEERDKHNGLHDILREKGAKTFGYAYIFGCGKGKSGLIVRDALMTARAKNPEWGFLFDRFFKKANGGVRSNAAVGGTVRQSFDERLNLGTLQDLLKEEMRENDNHIIGLDGRKVPCRSDHSALNFKLSSSEAILCKEWICNSCDEMERRGYKFGWDGDFVFMIWNHDEVQVACKETISEEVGQVLVSCAKEAGIKLGFRVPLASEFKIGRNWAECH